MFRLDLIFNNLRVTSDFRLEEDESRDLNGYYAAIRGNSLSKFRDP